MTGLKIRVNSCQNFASLRLRVENLIQKHARTTPPNVNWNMIKIVGSPAIHANVGSHFIV
jgi:hypothetical protein